MPSFPRPSGDTVRGGDTLAAGRGRQRLKLAAVGYFNSRHGIDADDTLVRVGRVFLRKMAIEFVAALSGDHFTRRKADLHLGDDEELRFVAIAYASARHGIDAEAGMVREGLATLCQAAIHFVESLPKDETKRGDDPRYQIGNGA